MVEPISALDERNYIQYDPEEFEEKAKELEFFRTSLWAIDRILDVELMTPFIVDPCCGDGRMGEVARLHNYRVVESDIQEWKPGVSIQDFLKLREDKAVSGRAVFINPPFSKADQFIMQAKRLGARKIVCFQRFAWWESGKRSEFWDEHSPSRIHICGNRATCWLGTIPPDQQKSGTTTAHAWFVWEKGHGNAATLHRIYK